MNHHPADTQLALYAGGDLGFWETRRVRAHVSSCAQCRQELQAFQTCTNHLTETADAVSTDVNWARLSQEMTGNIRVGLAAGEAIEGFDRSRRPARPRLVWNTGIFAAGALLVLITFGLNLSNRQFERVFAAIGQIRWARIGTSFHNPAVAQEFPVLEASPASIQVKINGRSLSLLHPHSEGVTVSLNMQDSAGVRYVDDDTGQVTINRVYYGK
jgi:hypothetical protein